MNPSRIDLPQTIPGLERFLGAWLLPGPPAIVIDPGPKASIGHLVNHLKGSGIRRVDYVWLTHIHIDHAGGVADFLTHFPQARVVTHAQGLKHLVDPSRLWEGSLKTLKDLARAYGPIGSVPEESLIGHETFALEGLEILDTPGHAPHHLAFSYEGRLFSGEAAGVYRPFYSKIYLRPPTPPRFFLEQALSSVEKMQAVSDQTIYYAHAGWHPDSRKMLGLYHDQLVLWREIVAKAMQVNPEDALHEATSRLLQKDPLLKSYNEMDRASQVQEKIFMENSILGFMGYLQEKAETL
jgi:glyoxylase-like metal-dependent hydrolase (beta-lactamase superfamily II)